MALTPDHNLQGPQPHAGRIGPHSSQSVNSCQRGLTMVELVVTIGIMALGMAAATYQLRTAMIAEKQFANQLELMRFTMKLINSVDCDRTLNPWYKDNKVPEPGLDYMLLLNDKGIDIAQKTIPNESQYGPFAGSSQTNGNWHYRTKWLSETDGIEIRMARKSKAGWGYPPSLGPSDPVQTFASPPIIGGAGSGFKLCAKPSKGPIEYKKENTTLSDIANITGVDLRSHCGSPLRIETCPLHAAYACDRLCNKTNYSSGWMTDIQTFNVTIVNGILIGTEKIDDESQYLLGCACVK